MTPDVKKIFILSIVAGGLIIVYFIFKTTRSNFSLTNHGDLGTVCGSHCFLNQNNEISDIYDCCTCQATTSGKFEPNFHQCMCSAGYGDYCFKPVTNMLLSQ